MESSQSLQNTATEAVAKFDKYYDNITSTDVIFTQDTSCIVEIFVSVHGSTLIAKELSEDFTKSLNLAVDKVVRQLKKQKTKDSKFKTEGVEY